MRRDKALEQELAALYRFRRAATPGASEGAREACIAACEDAVRATARASARAAGGTAHESAAIRLRISSFMRAQLRFVRPATWAAFVLVAVLVVIGCRIGGTAPAAPQLLSMAGGLLALICLTNVTRAKAFGMAELEGSCPFNAVAVVLARLFVMGAASVAVLAVGAFSTGMQGADAAQALLWMGAPYLVACAGGLMCARRAVSCNARTAAAVWSAGVAAVSALLFFAAPAAYASAAFWVWAAVCAGAGLWCAGEIRAWVVESGSGFTAQPHTRCA